MSYQTICAGFLQGDPRNQAVMDAAIKMALDQGAHLTGVHLVPPLNVPIYVAVPFPDDLMASYYADAEAEGEKLQAVFEARCESAGVESREWHGGARTVLTVLEELAAVTDLFVLAQHTSGDYDWLLGGSDALAGCADPCDSGSWKFRDLREECAARMGPATGMRPRCSGRHAHPP